MRTFGKGVHQARWHIIPHGHWVLNTRADDLATSGVRAHWEDPGGRILCAKKRRGVAEWQRHLLRCCKAVRAATGHGGVSPAELQPRMQTAGPATLPPPVLTDIQWHSGCALRFHDAWDACMASGRVSVIESHASRIEASAGGQTCVNPD